MMAMEYIMKTLRTVLGLIVFFGFAALVIAGQKTISYSGLAMMLAGLAGIIVCLWIYNRTHR